MRSGRSLTTAGLALLLMAACGGQPTFKLMESGQIKTVSTEELRTQYRSGLISDTTLIFNGQKWVFLASHVPASGILSEIKAERSQQAAAASQATTQVQATAASKLADAQQNFQKAEEAMLHENYELAIALGSAATQDAPEFAEAWYLTSMANLWYARSLTGGRDLQAVASDARAVDIARGATAQMQKARALMLEGKFLVAPPAYRPDILAELENVLRNLEQYQSSSDGTLSTVRDELLAYRSCIHRLNR